MMSWPMLASICSLHLLEDLMFVLILKSVTPSDGDFLLIDQTDTFLFAMLYVMVLSCFLIFFGVYINVFLS